ncbi:unnamed protein product [Hymenolepis diminuta]|uniref:DUF7041 domain-containing protein n=1 Tax=Hymenolepis diminuta TaxID=6216 RepID=A0A564Y820_HYMDI|nr:unnamed protein product [Hymenolepis diminuta]VUZ43415.1 unnamed protein product [Hymenolepis diminuta]
MANDFTIPRFYRFYVPDVFLFLEAQSRAYKITTKQVHFARLLNSLKPEEVKFMYDVLGTPSTTSYNDLKFALLGRMEEPKLEFSK